MTPDESRAVSAEFTDVHAFPAGEHWCNDITTPPWWRRFFLGKKAYPRWRGCVYVRHYPHETSLHWTSDGESHFRSQGAAEIAVFSEGRLKKVYRQAVTMWPIADAEDANRTARKLVRWVRSAL